MVATIVLVMVLIVMITFVQHYPVRSVFTQMVIFMMMEILGMMTVILATVLTLIPYVLIMSVEQIVHMMVKLTITVRQIFSAQMDVTYVIVRMGLFLVHKTYVLHAYTPMVRHIKITQIGQMVHV